LEIGAASTSTTAPATAAAKHIQRRRATIGDRNALVHAFGCGFHRQNDREVVVEVAQCLG
jgi:hypothetical protein